MGTIVILSSRNQLKKEIKEIIYSLNNEYTIKFIDNFLDINKIDMNNIILLIIDKDWNSVNILNFLENYYKQFNQLNLPIILIKEKIERETLIKAEKLGVRSYILYPYTLKNLNDKIVELLKIKDLSNHYVSEIIKRERILLRENYTIRDSLRYLESNKISGSVVISDNNKILGYISEKDLLSFVSLLLSDSDKILLSDVMVKEVLIIDINYTLLDALNFLSKNNLKQVPVVDNNKNYIGLVSKYDIINYILNQR